jgi:hypothetical protein
LQAAIWLQRNMARGLPRAMLWCLYREPLLLVALAPALEPFGPVTTATLTALPTGLWLLALPLDPALLTLNLILLTVSPALLAFRIAHPGPTLLALGLALLALRIAHSGPTLLALGLALLTLRLQLRTIIPPLFADHAVLLTNHLALLTDHPVLLAHDLALLTIDLPRKPPRPHNHILTVPQSGLPIGPLLLVPAPAHTAAIINKATIAGVVKAIVPAKARPQITNRYSLPAKGIAVILIITTAKATIAAIATGVGIAIAVIIAITWCSTTSILVSTGTKAHRGNNQGTNSKDLLAYHGNLRF